MEETNLETDEEFEDLDAGDSEREYTEEELALMEEEEDLGGDQGLMGYSEPKALGGLYALFDAVLNRPSSLKVSNVTAAELGDLGISIRDAKRIALLAKTFHHPIFAAFFLNQAGITTDSAMSKEGWFSELFITSKKYASKTSSSGAYLPQQNKKWRMFKKPQQENQEQNIQ